MKDDDNRTSDDQRLQLAKTKLLVENGELVRRDDAGKTTMRLPLDDIERVEFSRPFNAFCLFPTFLGAGLVALGLFLSDSNILSVILYAIALMASLFGLMGAREDVLRFTARGESFRVSCAESADEVTGFAVSLRSQIGGRGEG